MTQPLAFPDQPPSHGDVLLRAFTSADTDMLHNLSTDPYVPLTGTLPADADEAQALEYIERQHSRLTSGRGYSFCVALRSTELGIGQAGLWMSDPRQAVASAGYAIAPRYRGHAFAEQALAALAGFAWTLPHLHRIDLFIEPWNIASVRTAESAGFQYGGSTQHRQNSTSPEVEMLSYSLSR